MGAHANLYLWLDTGSIIFILGHTFDIVGQAASGILSMRLHSIMNRNNENALEQVPTAIMKIHLVNVLIFINVLSCVGLMLLVW